MNKGCVEKCVSSGKITVTQAEDAGQLYVGGIAGGTERTTLGNSSIKVCVHTGILRVSGKNKNVGQICGQMTSSVISDCYGKDSQGELIGSTAATESNGKLLTENQLKRIGSLEVSGKFLRTGFRQGWKLQTLRLFLHIYIVLLIVLGSVRIAGEFFILMVSLVELILQMI